MDFFTQKNQEIRNQKKKWKSLISCVESTKYGQEKNAL